MKDIPGFPNYAVSRDGRVWSNPRRRTKGGWVRPGLVNGYFQIGLCTGDKRHPRIHKFAHNIVLETFIGPRPKGMECRHLNGNKQDNRLENLCWGTHAENEKDKVRHGLTKLTEEKVKIIRYLRTIAKFSLDDIAWQFDVCRATICMVVNNKIWKCV